MREIVAINGSPADPSRCALAIRQATERLAGRGLHTHEIHVRALDPASLIHGDADEASVRAAIDHVVNASAVIVASPVYNASFTGALKTLLDLMPRDALAGKPVLPVVTSGTLAHYLAIEYALKPVLAALGGRRLLQGICFLDDDFVWNDGQVSFRRPAERRLAAAVDELCEFAGAPNLAPLRQEVVA